MVTSIFAAPGEFPPHHWQCGESHCSAISPKFKHAEVWCNLQHAALQSTFEANLIYLLSVVGAFVFLSEQEKPAILLCWDRAGE